MKKTVLKAMVIGAVVFLFAELIAFSYRQLAMMLVPNGTPYSIGADIVTSTLRVVYFVCKPLSRLIFLIFGTDFITTNQLLSQYSNIAVRIIDLIFWILLSFIVINIVNRNIKINLPKLTFTKIKRPLGIKVAFFFLSLPFIIYFCTAIVAISLNNIPISKKIVMVHEGKFAKSHNITSVEELDKYLKHRNSTLFNPRLLTMMVLPFILGFGVFSLKNWARISLVIYSVYAIAMSLTAFYINQSSYNLFALFCLLTFFLWCIYYLTRPKVKERFK